MNKPVDWQAAFKVATTQLLQHLKFALHRNDHSKLNLGILEQIKIDYFNSPAAVRFMVKAQKGQQGEYILTPFDIKLLKPIYEAISQAETNWQIALLPTGIRVALPFLTTEKKQTLTKEYKKIAEQSRIQLRQLRKEYLQLIKTEFSAQDQQIQQQNWLESQVTAFNQTIEQTVQTVIADLLKI